MPSPAPLSAAYLLLGDETYTRDQFRARLLERLEPAARPLAAVDEDLRTTPLDEVLDRAGAPSLLTPLQIYFVHGVKELFGRGGAGTKKKHGDFPANLQRFVAAAAAAPAPWAVLVFVADHFHIPAQRARIALEDRTQLERVQEAFAGLAETIECAQADPATAAALAADLARRNSVQMEAAAARLLADLLDANLGRIACEVEKLCLHAAPAGTITTDDVRELVASGGQSSALELAAQISRGDRRRSLACLHQIWLEEGDAGAVGLCFQLSRIFKMALIVRQARATDRRGLYAALPDGLRPPAFTVDTVLAVSRTPAPALKKAIIQLHHIDLDLRSTPLSAELLFEQLVLQS